MANSKYLSREVRNTKRKAEKRQKLYKNKRIQRKKEIIFHVLHTQREREKKAQLQNGVINFSALKELSHSLKNIDIDSV